MSSHAIYTNNQGDKWSGAGVLIVEDYRHKNGKTIKSVVLGRDVARKAYLDFGGRYDEKDINLENTARREAHEESAGLIDISELTLKKSMYVDSIGVSQTKYRIYFIKIDGICRRDYLGNIIILEKQNAPLCWMETNDIAHVPIENIKNFFKNSNGKIDDVNGNNIKIHNRVLKILSTSIKKLEQTVNGASACSKSNDGYIVDMNDFTKHLKTIKCFHGRDGISL